MLVSQYIYTACGKDRNGAFSVFSKSKDITEEESSEIREVMMYKTPSGLPYEPTDQEIEELFPKKFGCFFLSSGRVCLAQVCYVGRVYSDLDSRWGNYIIHAFIFEKNIDFFPYSFIEHEIFKRLLTRKEWHDDNIPDELPVVEIPENGGLLSNEEVSSFFNEERKKNLKLLIEAIINSTSDNSVSLNDDPKNHKYWFKILSLCLPRKLQNEISFCSHFTNTLIPGNISSRIQLKINRIENAQFGYAQEAQRGRYAFDFVKNIMPMSVTAGKYAESLIKLLSITQFEVVKFVNEINEIISSRSININEASNLINLSKTDYSNFINAEELFETILTADREDYNKQTIANNLWNKKPPFNFNIKQKLTIYTFIFVNISDLKTKIEIIKTIFDDPVQFGIRTEGAIAFRDDLKSKVNCMFNNYFDYIKSIGLSEYITQNKDSFIKVFFLFDYLVNLNAIKHLLQTHNLNSGEEISACKNIMNLTIKRQSIPDLDLLLNSMNLSSNNTGVELLSVIVQEFINSGANISNIQFAFDILQRLRNKKEFSYIYLMHIIKMNSEQEPLIKAYVNAQSTDNNFFLDFENTNKEIPIISDFCKKKDIYKFMNQSINLKNIKEYFEKYYIKGEDKGDFSKRLREYLYSIQEEKRIGECITVIDTLKFPNDVNKSLIVPVNCVILESIFSIKYDIINDFLCKKQELYKKIKELYFAAINMGGKLKQETCEVITISICGQILIKYDFKDNNQHVLSFFSKPKEDADTIAKYMEQINSKNGIDTLIDFYFLPIVNIFIFGATISDQQNYDSVLENAFGKIIEKGDVEKMTEIINFGMKETRTNSIMFILYIFRKLLSSSNKPIDVKYGNITEKYFETLSSGDRKKKFAELMSKASEKEAPKFEKYFDEFNKKHKSGLFGSFFKKNN